MNPNKISYQPPFGLRMPPEMRQWISDMAERNLSSMNREVLLCIKEKMEREKGLEASENEKTN